MRKILLFALCALFIGAQATKAQDVIYTVRAMNDGGATIRLDSIRIENRTNPATTLSFRNLPDSDVVRINMSQGIIKTKPKVRMCLKILCPKIYFRLYKTPPER